jgi:hypothetical protein
VVNHLSYSIMPIDYRKYNKGFQAKSRYIRFVRAANKCEHCGVINYQAHPRYKFKVVLSTAHLNHDRRDDSDQNLKALCQFCHLKHDLEHNIYLKKYGKNYQERQLLIPFINQLTIQFNQESY